MAFIEIKEGEYNLYQSTIASYPQLSCLCPGELRKGPFSHRQLSCWMPGIEPFLGKLGDILGFSDLSSPNSFSPGSANLCNLLIADYLAA